MNKLRKDRVIIWLKSVNNLEDTWDYCVLGFLTTCENTAFNLPSMWEITME